MVSNCAWPTATCGSVGTVGTLREGDQVANRAGTTSWRGPTKRCADGGGAIADPHCLVRNSPGVWRGSLIINARCIARMASASTVSDRATAVCIASVLRRSSQRCRLALPPGSSASAIARADAVKFSICELAADSDRSNTAANGAISPRVRRRNRVISWLADSASANTDGGKSRTRSATLAGTAGDRCRTAAAPRSRIACPAVSNERPR